jgi:hypothetical protein
MNTTAAPSDFIQRLRQDPQDAARVVAGAGQRVVGYVSDDVPVALILASGAHPVRLRGPANASTANVDSFVESSFAPELRAIADQWLRGGLDHLDAVVFARGDDSGQRLYYYLCELQRRGVCAGPRPLLYDIASLARGASVEHTLESTRLLATQLGVSAAMLPSALERVREREGLMRAVRARRLLPAPLAGSAAWACEFAAACDWRGAFDESARAWLEAAPLMHMPKRVLLAGDPPPDDQLHTAIEAAGASIVLELTTSVPAAGAAERPPREPIAAIAEEFQRRESPAISMRRDGRWLADAALDHRADSLLLWLSEQNEALPWEVPRQVRALRAAGIPVLLLERQPANISATVLSLVMHFVRTSGAVE